MQIEREHVKQVFKEYTSAYDVTDEKVKLKIGHTYRVADLCERIVRAEVLDGGQPCAEREIPAGGMTKEDIDLAWLLGMLHDVGRFEQLRRYNTFIDAESVDHAALGADILFGAEEHRIRDYIAGTDEDTLIETAIRVHSAYRIPENLPQRTEMLCHVLRDADKIDILRVNVESPLEEIYNTTTEELRNTEVTDEVLNSFYEHHAVLRSLKRTPVDHIAGHISLVFELVYDESLRIVKEQGYLDKLLHFQSDNPKTMEQFAKMRAEMERYFAKK